MELVTSVDYQPHGSLCLVHPLSKHEATHLKDGGSVAYRLYGMEEYTLHANEVDLTRSTHTVQGLTLGYAPTFPIPLFRVHLEEYLRNGWYVTQATGIFGASSYQKAIDKHRKAFFHRYDKSQFNDTLPAHPDSLPMLTGECRIEVGLSHALNVMSGVMALCPNSRMRPGHLHIGLSHGAWKGAVMFVNTQTHRMVEVSSDESTGDVKLMYGYIKFPRIFRHLWRWQLKKVCVSANSLPEIADGILTYLDGSLPTPH